MPEFVFFTYLVYNKHRVTVGFDALYAHFPCNFSKAMYFATLLEQGSISENVREVTCFWGDTSTNPPPAMTCPLGPARVLRQNKVAKFDSQRQHVLQTLIYLIWEVFTPPVLDSQPKSQ